METITYLKATMYSFISTSYEPSVYIANNTSSVLKLLLSLTFYVIFDYLSYSKY
jgi:hypothetical protein